MNCQQCRPLIGAHLDGELAPGQAEAVASHLAGCEACRRERAELAALKENLGMIRFKEPTDAELERYWSSVYNRLERAAGWVLLSAGAILLGCWGAFKLVEQLVRDPHVALAVKIGVVALLFGLVVLVVSVLRERLTVRRSDRYSREVQR